MRNAPPGFAVLAAAALLASCREPAPPAPKAAAPSVVTPGKFGTSAVAGAVFYRGPHEPPRKPASREAFPDCGDTPPPDPVPVDAQGRLANVLVWIQAGLPPGDYPVPEEPVRLDQKGCEYVPRVFGLRAGQPLQLFNSDPLLHNVHSLGGGPNPMVKGPNAFNVAMPLQNQKLSRTFAQPQLPPVTITCDVHPWMRAYAGVSAHPFFAVTGADGSFELARLPAGTYTVAFWQERYGVLERSATVAEGERARLEVEFKP